MLTNIQYKEYLEPIERPTKLRCGECGESKLILVSENAREAVYQCQACGALTKRELD